MVLRSEDNSRNRDLKTGINLFSNPGFRNLILSYFIFIGFSVTYAQTNPNLSEGIRLFDKGKYTEAELFFSKVATECEKTNNTDDPDYATAVEGLAKICTKKGKYPTADSLFRKVLRIRENINGSISKEYTETLNNYADLKLRSEELTDIEELLSKAIDTEKNGRMDQEYAKSVSILGYYYLMHLRDTENAGELLKAAADLYLKTTGDKHPDYAQTLLYLGKFYLYSGDFDSAEKYYEKALNIYKETFGKDQLDYGVSLLFLSTLYISSDKLEKGAEIISRSLDIIEKNTGKEHPNYIEALSDLGYIYFTTGNFEKAEAAFSESLYLSDIVLNKTHRYYLNALNSLALLYQNYGFYDKAAPLLKETVDLRKEKYGKFHINVVNAINNLGTFYVEMNDFSEAEKYFLEALDIIVTTGKQNTFLNYPLILGNLAHISHKKGDFKKSIALYEEALSIEEKTVGKNHSEYVTTLYNLGTVYVSAGNFNMAEPIFKESIQLFKEVSGKKSIKYYTAVQSLSVLYSEMEEYDKAEPFALQALEIAREIHGDSHRSVADALNNLGNLYQNLGNYDEAERLLKEAIEVNDRIFGKDCLDNVVPFNNLFHVYSGKGDKTKGLEMLEKAYEIQQKHLGKDHPDCLSLLNNIVRAKYLGSDNTDDEVEEILLEILEKRKELLGENHPDYAKTMNDLAIYYFNKKNYEKASYFYIKALDLTKKEDQLYSAILLNLGALYEKQNNIDEARSYFIRYFDYLKNYVEKNFAFLSEKERGLFWKSNNYIIDYFKYFSSENKEKKPDVSAFAFNCELFSKGLLLNSSLEKQELILNTDDENIIREWKELTRKKDLYTDNESKIKRSENSVFRTLIIDYPGIAEKVFSETKDKKYIQGKKEIAETRDSLEFMLNDLPEFENDIRQSKKEILELIGAESSEQADLIMEKHENEKLVEAWKTIKDAEESFPEFQLKIDELLRSSIAEEESLNLKFLQELSLNSPDVFIEIISETKDKELVQQFENLLSLRKEQIDLNRDIQLSEKKDIFKLSDNVKRQQDFYVKWEDVRNALNTDEAAVEFIRFINYDALKYVYGALILRPDSQYPEMISLCSEDELQKAVKKLPEDSRDIYSLILQPTEKYLNNIKQVYVAPAGLLHSVSFPGIRTGSGYLDDHYLIRNLLSSKDIINLKKQTRQNRESKRAVLFGGADYGISGEELALADKDLTDIEHANLTRGMLDRLDPTRGQGFDFLPGSKKEVQLINKLLSELNWETYLYTDEKATETRLKSFSSLTSPEVLHISTHGFYFPEQKQLPNDRDISGLFISDQNIYRISDDPLMRSGLAFSGANQIWNGKEVPNDIDDGILTAYEVSNLNLKGTELVVLSACETGLGDVLEGEGVYGLQRAFRLAGVQAMIVSLWKVPDKETVELMEEFYRNKTKGVDQKEAFRKSRNKLRTQYPENPEKWAGFVLVE